MSAVRTLCGSSSPLYFDAVFNDAGISGMSSSDEYTFAFNGWECTLNLHSSNILMTGNFSYKQKYDLTGLYNNDEGLFPIGLDSQAAEPPSMICKNYGAFAREFEFWTTVELKDADLTNLFQFASPVMPSFDGWYRESSITAEQIIAGKATTWIASTAVSNPTFGYMVPIHSSAIGEGMACVGPDLHYTRVIYTYSAVANFAQGSWLIDFPSRHSLLTVAIDKVSDPAEFLTYAARGVQA